MNLTKLAYKRAQCLALLEFVAGWDTSSDCDERALYVIADRAYRNAEAQFQRACSLYTPAELRALGVAA